MLVKVSDGEKVEAGQELIVIEAMKMELSLKAPQTTTIASLRACWPSATSAALFIARPTRMRPGLPDASARNRRPAAYVRVIQMTVRASTIARIGQTTHGMASPVTVWLRALAKQAHDECGGPGVGAVGMCFTGGFALAMMVDDTVVAPVLSQPSLPFPVTGKHKRDLGISDSDLQRVKERVDDGVCVIGLRFTGDKTSPGERFERLRQELGDGFIGVEIDSSKGNPYGHPTNAHSVLTNHLIDEPGQPTRDALDKVLAFFEERLLK